VLNMLVPYPVLRPITRYLEKRVNAGVDMVLPNTPQYSKYIAGMGVADSRTRYLPFPIDTDLFSPSADSSEVRGNGGLIIVSR